MASTQQIASQFETTPRELRKFMRAQFGEGRAVVGKGARYELADDARSIKKLHAQYLAWRELRDANRAKKDEGVNSDISPELTESSQTE